MDSVSISADHVPFMTVDEAKYALGLNYTDKLRPTTISCTRCDLQPARALAGDHVCLWCRVAEKVGHEVWPRSSMPEGDTGPWLRDSTGEVIGTGRHPQPPSRPAWTAAPPQHPCRVPALIAAGLLAVAVTLAVTSRR